MVGSDRLIGGDRSTNGNGPDDEDGPSVGFVDVKVTGSEVLLTSTTWSVNLSTSLTQPANGDSRVKVFSSSFRDEQVSRGKKEVVR